MNLTNIIYRFLKRRLQAIRSLGTARAFVVVMVMAALASYAITQTPQNPQRKLSVRKTRDAAPQRNGSAGRIDSLVVKAQPKLENEDSIPD